MWEEEDVGEGGCGGRRMWEDEDVEEEDVGG